MIYKFYKRDNSRQNLDVYYHIKISKRKNNLYKVSLRVIETSNTSYIDMIVFYSIIDSKMYLLQLSKTNKIKWGFFPLINTGRWIYEFSIQKISECQENLEVFLKVYWRNVQKLNYTYILLGKFLFYLNFHLLQNAFMT